jgi:hypothetical protein
VNAHLFLFPPEGFELLEKPDFLPLELLFCLFLNSRDFGFSIVERSTFFVPATEGALLADLLLVSVFDQDNVLKESFHTDQDAFKMRFGLCGWNTF